MSASLLLAAQAAGNCVYSTDSGAWTAQNYTTGGIESSPGNINVSTLNFQPAGTVLASVTSSPLALNNSLKGPEHILFRCAAADVNDLYEYYGTEAGTNLSTLTGLNEDGAPQVPAAYRSQISGVLVRLTNMSTGNYFTKAWQKRRLVDLDRDNNANYPILVKAKNFSNVKLEFIRYPNEAIAAAGTPYQPFTGTGAITGVNAWNAGYLAFIGPGIAPGNISEGSLSGWWTGAYAYAYVGSINYSGMVAVRRAASCKINTVTPYIRFPTLTVSQLNNGQTAREPLDIIFDCQPNRAGLSTFNSSSVDSGGTAMAIMVPYDKAMLSLNNLSVTSAGIPYLIADNYGSPGITQGVGVSLSRQSDGVAVYFAMPTSIGNFGWLPVLDGAIQVLTTGPGGDIYYRKTLNATFGKIPGKTVTPGRYRAQAEVLIRVQ
ncbi:fimbrial protein [Neisseriaceae bacterium TC5R-5]|nr:fimbrial protein [Neisseriaceae bacterium TC5R-5]